MVKFLIGIGTGVLLTILTVVLVFLALLRFREKPPSIADNSVLVLRLSGDIPEKPPMEYPFFMGDGPGMTVANVWSTLRKAAADPHIKAVVLEPEGLGVGWGKLEELRADLEQFKKSGKPLWAYLRSPGTREYYVATAADRIYLGPEDPLMLKGMRVEMMYFKNTLDKLGVTVDVEHAGKYKDFGDMFTRPNMSPETREVMTSVLDDLYGNLVRRIAEGRRKTPDQVRAIIDRGPFQATEAKAEGLVDELRFEDQLWGDLKVRLQAGELKKVPVENYLKVPGEEGKTRIALVIGEGDILRGSPSDDGSSEDGLTSYGFSKLLRRVGEDATIRGAVIRIDSPGGEVTASDDIWREMNLLSRKKPVVISMSDAAASGGYYIAMTGDPIIAYPGTMTGSIGVVFGKPNLRGLYDKLGITKDSIERGRFAGIDSDYRPLDGAGRDKLRQGIDASYREFVNKVASARRRGFDDVEPLAQGRVWLGSQAKANGLVDELGGLDRAVDLLKRKAHVPAAEKVSIVTFPSRRSILDFLMRRTQTEDALESKLAAALDGAPVRAWLHGGFLRLTPYWIQVR